MYSSFSPRHSRWVFNDICLTSFYPFSIQIFKMPHLGWTWTRGREFDWLHVLPSSARSAIFCCFSDFCFAVKQSKRLIFMVTVTFFNFKRLRMWVVLPSERSFVNVSFILILNVIKLLSACWLHLVQNCDGNQLPVSVWKKPSVHFIKQHMCFVALQMWESPTAQGPTVPPAGAKRTGSQLNKHGHVRPSPPRLAPPSSVNIVILDLAASLAAELLGFLILHKTNVSAC